MLAASASATPNPPQATTAGPPTPNAERRTPTPSSLAPLPWAEAVRRGPVRFTTDLLPVLTKAGCNQGSCHGAQVGKGGFRLSLRGWDPAFDWEQITKEDKGKRVDKAHPEKSLLFLKPT